MKYNIPLDNNRCFAEFSFYGTPLIQYRTLHELFKIGTLYLNNRTEAWQLKTTTPALMTKRKIFAKLKKFYYIDSKKKDFLYDFLKDGGFDHYAINLSLYRENGGHPICGCQLLVTKEDLIKLKSFGVKITEPQTVEVYTFANCDRQSAVARFGVSLCSTKKETPSEALTPRHGGLDLGA